MALYVPALGISSNSTTYTKYPSSMIIKHDDKCIKLPNVRPQSSISPSTPQGQHPPSLRHLTPTRSTSLMTLVLGLHQLYEPSLLYIAAGVHTYLLILHLTLSPQPNELRWHPCRLNFTTVK